MRLPRFSQGIWQAAKSSGHGLIPTPNVKRFFVRYATDASCFATIAGWRIASLKTDVEKWSFVVTAPIAGTSVNGSRNGTPSRNSRLPSRLYGYLLSDSSG